MTTWGRKETIYWPPRAPIYTLFGIAAAALCTCAFAWQTYRFQQTPVERFYTGAYVRSAVGALAHQHGKYRVLYVLRGKGAHPAVSSDVVNGPKHLEATYGGRLALSPPRPFLDSRIHAWLQYVIFDGNTFFALYRIALLEGAAMLGLSLIVCIPADVKRRKVMKYGRRLKGPVMLTPKEWNKTLKGTGLGIRTLERGQILRIPRASEAKHIQIMGDTGAGKSTLIMQMLQQIQDRGESAIVYDPAGEFIQRFYSETRKDIVLNPLDARCPYWSPSSELRNPAEARTIAASLYQPTNKNKGEFFTETPQKIFARLLLYRPSPRDLAHWMANEDEIDRRVEGTPMRSMINKGAQQQRSGVLASLGLVADGLMLLPTQAETDREWSANEWSRKREGWIFLTGSESEQEALRPLHSLWIDLLILRLLTQPQPDQKRAWFVLDEVASLQRLPQFHTALTKGRKSDNPIIFGYQGKAQIEDTYAQLAEVMLSQPATKFVLKTAEPKAAKWASELLGDIEIERLQETVSNSRLSGTSMTMARQIEPLVMPSEIAGLDDLHAFVKLGNYVSRFSFPHMDRPLIARGFVPRETATESFWLNPPPMPQPAAAKNIPAPGTMDTEDETEEAEAPFSL